MKIDQPLTTARHAQLPTLPLSLHLPSPAAINPPFLLRLTPPTRLALLLRRMRRDPMRQMRTSRDCKLLLSKLLIRGAECKRQSRTKPVSLPFLPFLPSTRAEQYASCARNCFECPECPSALHVVASDPPPSSPQTTGHPPYLLECRACGWNSSAISLTFSKPLGLARESPLPSFPVRRGADARVT